MRVVKSVVRGILLAVICIGIFGVVGRCSEVKPKIIGEDTSSPVQLKAEPAVTLDVPQFDCAVLGGADKCTAAYVFDDYVNTKSATTFILWLLAAEFQGVKHAVVQINSRGGELYAGEQIMVHIENSSMDISCVADMETASMAFGILQSCDHRFMTKRTFLMTHQVALEGAQISDANEIKILNLNNNLKATQDAFDEHAIHRMNITMADYKLRVKDGRQWFMGWQDAIKYGAVDRIVPSTRWVVDKLVTGKPIQ